MNIEQTYVRCEDPQNTIPGKMTIFLLFVIIAVAGWTFPVDAESSDMERPDRPKIGYPSFKPDKD